MRIHPLVIILGPTGVGKTAFAIRLAQMFDAEIISADSMQVYRYMDIGTAKPDPTEMKQVPHHLVDFLDPDQSFDAGQYVQAADKAIEHIFSLSRQPFVAGGTGLYIKALESGLIRKEPVSEKVMSQLTAELESEGPAALYQKLLEYDPAAAGRIHPHDSFRIIRALEFFLSSGSKISSRREAHRFSDRRYHCLKIGLYLDRDELYERINRRVDQMMRSGLLEEVRSLLDKGYSFDLKSMQAIGYQHMGMVIRKEAGIEEAVRLLKRDTRRYAKRQFTWFRRDLHTVWMKPWETERAAGIIKDFLT